MGRARASAVVVAAGAGTRLGADEPKSLLEIGGRTIVAVAVGAVVASPAIDDVVVAAPPGFEDRVLAALSELDSPIAVVSGGETRQRSVAIALQAVSAASEIVVIHDAARPFASPDLFTAVVQAVASGADGAVPILPLTDTVKRVLGDLVVQTEAREELGLAADPTGVPRGRLARGPGTRGGRGLGLHRRRGLARMDGRPGEGCIRRAGELQDHDPARSPSGRRAYAGRR